MEAFLKGRTGVVKKKSENVEDIAKSSGRKISKRPVNTPWVEKYRPKTIEDVAYQEEVIAVLRKTMKSADLPNLLFYGPPGTGKTSTILAAARELFGPLFSERVLELNASDERGIQVVRDKVKKFSQLAASSTRPDGKTCPPYKIVILDEADSMTSPAQAALRRTMEKDSRSTRFCLICNYVSRIIEPITSRCSKFRFKPLASEILLNRLQEICEKEEIDCSNEALSAIIENSEGDMRKAITSLQSASRLKSTDPVTVTDINEIAGVVPDKLVDELIKVCHSGSYEKLEIVVKDIMLEGHPAGQMFAQLFDKLLSGTDFSNKTKSAVVEQIAVADKCLHDGADEYLQVMTVCTFMMQELCHNL